MKKVVLVLSLAFGFVFSVFGHSLNGFQLEVNGGEITITGYSGQYRDVVIPESISDMPVVAIGRQAFAFHHLTSITIPNNVSHIGNSAFTRNELASVCVGNSVSHIGNGAFPYNQLASVSIPNSVFFRKKCVLE